MTVFLCSYSVHTSYWLQNAQKGWVSRNRFEMDRMPLPPHCRRQQIGYLILYGIGFPALVAVEGTLYYFVPLFRFYGQGQGAFAPGAGQDFHQFPFHRSSHKRRN